MLLWVRFTLVVFIWWAVNAQAERRVFSSWPTTTNYLGFVDFEKAIDGQIHVSVGGQYALYLGGDLIGEAENGAGLVTYDVSFKRKTNNIALVVNDEGTPDTYGFLMALETEEGLIVASSSDRTSSWFWSGYPLENEADAKWMKLKSNKLDRHTENGETVSWNSVQEGSLPLDSFAEISGLQVDSVKSIAGYPGGCDGGRNGLQLRSFKGLNLAMGSYSGDPNLVDGDINTSLNFRRGASALLQSTETDLGRLVPINSVRVLTEPPSRGSFEDVSLKGYSIFLSKDGVDFTEVGSANNIVNFQETTVEFETIFARYVRLVVTDFSNRESKPSVGEMEVYGDGVDGSGQYTSLPIALASGSPVNFSSVHAYGEVPDQTDMELRFRTGSDGVNWEEWSAWQPASESGLNVAEPRGYIQFQVSMDSRNVLVSPRLDSLLIEYDSEIIPASNAQSWIVPSQVPIGQDVDFTYNLQIGMDGVEGEGVSHIAILTQWPAVVDFDAISSTGQASVDSDRSYVTDDSLVIHFSPFIDQSVELTIPFSTRLLSAKHDFSSFLFSPQSQNPLKTDERMGVNELSGEPFALIVTTDDFEIPILQDVESASSVFTPNGDSVNDEMALRFTLGRVEGVTLRLEIYTLSGRRVRTELYERVASGRLSSLVRWDGRDDAGNLVAPGMYLYKLVVDLNPTESVSVGSIGVAW